MYQRIDHIFVTVLGHVRITEAAAMALLVGITDSHVPGVAQIEVELDDQGTAELTTRVPWSRHFNQIQALKFVRYLRVSTQKQGIDGNGMAFQERDIDIFLKGQIDPEVIGTYCEVESGAVAEDHNYKQH